MDTTGRTGIPRSMQLVAGRTGQEYNQRKRRKGAFWEDRYHAVAIESGQHLICRRSQDPLGSSGQGKRKAAAGSWDGAEGAVPTL